jgi:formiminotetrahydrofolate cyclodeaminase
LHLSQTHFVNLAITRIFIKKIRVMNTKLTLSVEKDIIEKAKSYAKATGKSLSELIENYLENITKDRKTRPITNKLNKIVGSVKLPKNFNEKKEIRSYLEKKHL